MQSYQRSILVTQIKSKALGMLGASNFTNMGDLRHDLWPQGLGPGSQQGISPPPKTARFPVPSWFPICPITWVFERCSRLSFFILLSLTWPVASITFSCGCNAAACKALAHSPARRHRLGCLRLIASIGLRSRRDRCSLVVVCIMAVCGGSHRAQPLLTSHRRAERHCPRRLENPSREVTESTERGPNRCYSLTLLATRMYLPLSPGPVSKIPSSPAGVQGRLASDRWPGLRVVAMGVAHDCHAQVFGMCARTLESRLADGSGLVLRASMAHPCSPCSDHDSCHG